MSKIFHIVTILNLFVIWCSCQLDTNEITDTKRVEKCQTYSEYVYTTVTIPAFRPDSQPLVQKINRCGRNSAPFVLGGVEAMPREYPHAALIGYQNGSEIVWGCGGSLVSSRYILTAGHCLHSSQFGPIVKVRLGDLNYSSNMEDATPQDYEIERIIPHPEYRSISKYNDIALLKLAVQVKFSPYIRPICLPTSDLEPKEYIAIGWGFTTESGDPSDSLMKVQLQSFPSDICKKVYEPFISRKFRNGVVETQICAGHRAEVKDTCTGDSGGSLLIYHPDVPCSSIQLGVTSFSNSCGIINFPAIYTRVFPYTDWIESVIWAPGEDF